MTKIGPQLTKQSPLHVAIACYPGAQATCIHGLTDLFMYADYFAREHAAKQQAVVRVTHWRHGADGDALECTYDSDPGPFANPAVCIVPACQMAPPKVALAPQSVAWVKQRHSEGAVVAAVCGGVFLLAESGLLAGRRATTHWMFAQELQRRFPDLDVDSDRLVIDESDVITAGGVLAWADMGLSLVERLLGPTVMCTTARFMLMDPPGREQRAYGEFTPHLQHGDKTILSIQHWLQANSTTACSVSRLADRVNLSERTFLRRFMKATGVKPSEYHQRLRVARSRELLEFTRDSVEQIAAATGYEDPGGFRRIFKRVVGLSPTEYRRRFQRAPQVTQGVR
ncbi:MAG TPA: GlxA family transcriptional regulator [Steroidobacteraceae bacterium]